MNRRSFYWQFSKLVIVATLVILVIGWSQAGRLAWAQEPDSAHEEIATPVAPVSPLATPEPTTKTGDQAIDQHPTAAPVDVGLILEPEVTPEPTTETEPTTAPPDTDIIIDPPSAAELGEPVKDEHAVARDDITDEENQPIDIFDLAFVAARYGTDDPTADINFDGAVDIFDLAILASNYGQLEPAAGAIVVTPTPLPEVEVSGVEFGAFDLPVEANEFEAEAQYYQYRPLRVGVSLNYLKIYDATDSTSAPDPYAMVSVSQVPVRTSTAYDSYEIWPYWRLGWWRYAYFPWASRYSSAANSYYLPINIEIRDDDGYVCYGYYGCRYQYQSIDVSPPRYSYSKRLTLYPASCMLTDEAGTRTYGTWFNSNHCRVYLQSWGSEWPRGYMSYYVDAVWE
ncbi:MAG: hypothetical protein JW953_07500 [Anaerolineae bacterium]|nr:hypothetical protein [Anaerolineae bacterium]